MDVCGMSKYHSTPMVVDGHRFPSKKEANKYAELRLMERAGIISDLKLQVRYPLEMCGQTVTHYVADFVFKENGNTVVCDVKGFRTDLYRLKKKMMKAQYNVEILEV